MSERDTTAKAFFEIVGVDENHRVHEIYFAAGDYALSAMIRDTLANTAPLDELAEEYPIYCSQIAARHKFTDEEMGQVIRESQDTVADKYGLSTGRAS